MPDKHKLPARHFFVPKPYGITSALRLLVLPGNGIL